MVISLSPTTEYTCDVTEPEADMLAPGQEGSSSKTPSGSDPPSVFPTTESPQFNELVSSSPNEGDTEGTEDGTPLGDDEGCLDGDEDGETEGRELGKMDG